VVVLGWDPFWDAHFDNGQRGPGDRPFEGSTGAGIATMDNGGAIDVAQRVPVRDGCRVVVHFEHLVRPTPLENACWRCKEGHLIQESIKAARVGQCTEGTQPFLNPRRPDHGQWMKAFAIGDIAAFEKKEGETKDMVAVRVGHQHRPKVSR